MAATRFPSRPTEFCITDVGSTTTKAILFLKQGKEWRFFREEAPTTVEKPHEDVAVGVIGAIRALERKSGRTLLDAGGPAVPFLSTSSAGGGLAMVVAGLVKDITAETADRVALGAGAIVLDVLAMDDGRTPYYKIEELRRLRPDMVLLAGGFDGNAISGPVYLAELILESGLHPKLNPDAKLAVIYAGNVNAGEYVRRAFSDRYAFCPVANIRPEGNRENLEPARKAIHDLFMNHVMSQAPGYERLKSWVCAPIEPTPAAFGKILGLVSRDLDKTILAVDIGGATTDVFTATRGRVFRTVSANLGMSYSILNVAELGGVDAIRKLHHSDLTETELWNRIGNKYINPTRLAATHDEMTTEWAAASIAIREAVAGHLKVMRGAAGEPASTRPELDNLLRGMKRDWKRELQPEEKPELVLEDYDLVIGSGGILSHSPRAAAAMMLLDALQPRGVVELAVDSAFMFPHLGVLAEVNPELARKLFYELGIVRLGTVLGPGREDAASPRLAGTTSHGREIAEKTEPGEVKLVPLADGESLKVKREAEETGQEIELSGGECGLILDARARPIEAGAGTMLPAEYVPPGRETEPEREESVQRGEIRMRRELAIPGEVFVRNGDRVGPDTLVGRSVRQFLRPFFVDVARGLEVEPGELKQHLVKKVGDEIEQGDIVARKKRRWGPAKTFRSPVAGRIEKVLETGVIVVREKPEHARELTAVKVAEAMKVEPRELRPYLKVEVGQEVDRGQWLAARVGAGLRFCASPVRGKVNRIDFHFGMVMIEPLLEEKEVYAWLPGTVEEVTDKGCVVKNNGVVVRGVWGRGGEAHGQLSFGDAAAGKVMVRQFVAADELVRLREKGAAGLVTGGLDMKDVLSPDIGFTVVVLEGFGRQEIASDMRTVMEANQDRLALVDGTTQLRVGVRRPRLILPGPEVT